MIDGCLDDPCYAQGRKEARRQAWVHPGEGAARTADYLIAKYSELTKEKEEAR